MLFTFFLLRILSRKKNRWKSQKKPLIFPFRVARNMRLSQGRNQFWKRSLAHSYPNIRLLGNEKCGKNVSLINKQWSIMRLCSTYIQIYTLTPPKFLPRASAIHRYVIKWAKQAKEDKTQLGGNVLGVSFFFFFDWFICISVVYCEATDFEIFFFLIKKSWKLLKFFCSLCFDFFSRLFD